jgi:hypothetical protein
MKRTVFIVMLAFASILGYSQTTNPLNYSGRMYVEAIEIYATPRYISYEDHAIVSQQMRIPSVEITKIDMDFDKGTVTVKDTEMKVKVNGCKRYEADHGWKVVVYMELVNEGDKAELVWPEFGKPYFQQITKADDGVKIARMVLSRKPYVADEGEALMNLLQGLGTM